VAKLKFSLHVLQGVLNPCVHASCRNFSGESSTLWSSRRTVKVDSKVCAPGVSLPSRSFPWMSGVFHDVSFILGRVVFIDCV